MLRLDGALVSSRSDFSFGKKWLIVMARDSSEVRLELIRRLLELPDDRLADLERMIDGFELGTKEIEKEEIKKQIFQSSVKPEHSQNSQRCWPHAPVHRVSEHGTYIVTAATLNKCHLFRGEERLDLLESKLLELAEEYGWDLEAWAVFSNHYHFVGHSREGSSSVNVFLSHLHTATAAEINQRDDQPGRQVWHNFWETRLSFEKSYFARLNYVHQNAVHHRLVTVANQYRWCSAAWFEETATPAQVATIYSFKIDRVKVYDDFGFGSDFRSAPA